MDGRKLLAGVAVIAGAMALGHVIRSPDAPDHVSVDVTAPSISADDIYLTVDSAGRAAERSTMRGVKTCVVPSDDGRWAAVPC